MEHVIIAQLPNGYVKLVPEQGYILYNTATSTTYSEAVVSEESTHNFKAIAINS